MLHARHRYRVTATLVEGNWTRDNRATHQRATLLQVMQYGITIYHRVRVSARDLYPRHGQRLDAGYAHTPFKNKNLGRTWWVAGNLYLPGLAPHHALVLYAGYQRKSRVASAFGNQVHSPRGTYLSGSELFSSRFSYYLPLAYPDLSITPLLHVRRVTAGVFVDAAAERSAIAVGGTVKNGKARGIHSLGIEAGSDARFFNLTFPVNLGFRAGYETRNRAPFFNLLFSIGLSI